MSQNMKDELKEVVEKKLEAGSENWMNSFRGYYYDLLHHLRQEKVYIYGAGRFGSGGAWHLMHSGIHPIGFIDKNLKSDLVRGLPVFTLDSIEENLCDSTIIIMLGDVTEAKEVKSFLQKKGAKAIYIREPKNDFVLQMFFWEIAQHIVNGSDWHEFISGVNDGSLYQAYDLLEDEKSKKAYLTFLKVMCTGEYEPEDYDDDYMAEDVPLNKGYHRFIDAGAYHGENGIAIHEKFGPLDAVAFIEPDEANMTELKRRLADTELGQKSSFFTGALWDHDTVLNFNNVASVGSHLSNGGAASVKCFAIDSVLSDFKPTMIKMDVEKAEYQALLGAKTVIKENRPDLLISVYHSVDDIWRLILLIHSWGYNYRFYLRHHNPWGVDTVLYAVCKD